MRSLSKCGGASTCASRAVNSLTRTRARSSPFSYAIASPRLWISKSPGVYVRAIVIFPHCSAAMISTRSRASGSLASVDSSGSLAHFSRRRGGSRSFLCSRHADKPFALNRFCPGARTLPEACVHRRCQESPARRWDCRAVSARQFATPHLSARFLPAVDRRTSVSCVGWYVSRSLAGIPPAPLPPGGTRPDEERGRTNPTTDCETQHVATKCCLHKTER